MCIMKRNMHKNVFYHISFNRVFVSKYLYIKPLYLHILHDSMAVFPPSRSLPCQNAVRLQDVKDLTTWPTSPAGAALRTPAPPRMKKMRRGEKQEEEEEEPQRRGRRKFLTTSGKAKRRIWLNAQVK